MEFYVTARYNITITALLNKILEDNKMNIGIKIRELRKKRGITQERLAEYLTVSAQAVSKWENGTALPDITLVPKLSAFFGVSTDELFSTKPEVTDKKLLEFKEKLTEYKRVYDYESAAELMEQAIAEYPSNYEFMWELLHALSHKRRRDRDLSRIIPLCERIVEDCHDETIRQCAIQMLCISYSDNGQQSEAVNLANSLPDCTVERDWLLEMILSGEDKIVQAQKNLAQLADRIVSQLIHLSSNDYMGLHDDFTYAEQIHFAETALTVYSTIVTGGHKSPSSGAWRHIYERMSELYLWNDDIENGMKYLRLAAEAAEYYDKFAAEGALYEPVFVNRCKTEITDDHYIDSVRLLQLMDTRKPFDAVRDTAEYKEIEMRLKAVSGE